MRPCADRGCGSGPSPQVRQVDLGVLVGGVGEGAAPVHVPEGPQPVDGRAVLRVRRHEAPLVGLQAHGPQAQALGVRSSPDGEQQVAAGHLARAGTACAVPAGRPDGHDRAVVAPLPPPGHPRGATEAYLDAVRLQDAARLGGDVVVLPREHALPGQQGDPAAEAGEHLRELAADVPAAHDHQVLGQLVQGEQALLGDPGDVVQAVDRRHRRPRPHVEVDLRGEEDRVADHDAEAVPVAAVEPPRPLVQVHAVDRAGPLLHALARRPDDRADAPDDARVVHADLAHVDAVLVAPAGLPRHPGGRPQGLRRAAAVVQAGAAEVLGLDQRHPTALRGVRRRHRGARLARAQDHHVVLAHESTVAGVGHRSPARRHPGGRSRARARPQPSPGPRDGSHGPAGSATWTTPPAVRGPATRWPACST